MALNRRTFLASLATVGAGALTLPAWASSGSWPSRPVRVLSGGSPGGTSDVFMRFLGNALNEKFAQSFIIENMPGAGGLTAAAAAARATDGHTLFISNLASNVLSVLLRKNDSVDPESGLPGVARFCTLANGLVVRADSGIDTAQQFFDALRSDPAKRVFGSGGAGTSSHLACVLVGQRLGSELLHIPYNGTAANSLALLRGDVFFTVDNLPSYTANIQAGKLKLLAVSTAQRSSLFPDVPTLQEAGLPDVDMFGWFGLSASASTPKQAIQAVSDGIVRTLQDPAVRKRFADVGAEPAPMPSPEYQAFIRSELQKWAPLVQSTGMAES